MDKLYTVAGQVMGFFEAFKGSRPAINNNEILIVRGKSRKTIPIDEMESKLDEIGKIIGGTEINPNSEKSAEILRSGDQHIQTNEPLTPTIDTHGLERTKKELESMGLVVKYKIFSLPTVDVVIAIWEDKSEIAPLFVEVTVSNPTNPIE